MDDLRLEKLIDETLSTIDPVEVPKDLHFDAAKIMRLARMEEEAEAEAQREEKRAPLSVLSRLRESFQSRSWTRYAAAAAAFAVLLGVYGFSQSGKAPSVFPGGNDPTHTAEVIDDGEIPLADPDDIPGDTQDPVTEPEQEPVADPVETEDPQPAVTPAPPVQSAENPVPVTPQPVPSPQPEDPPVEEEPGTVDDPTQYAGGVEADPQDPSADPQDPAEGDAPQEDILGSLLELAMQNESFAQSFAAEDKGFGYKVLRAEDVPDGTQFMVYFYENEEESSAQTVNEENVRSILWKRESL